jgi:phenylpropionate dioxygenase-like ring-hydroxylating dioxygenase large terminal subunit
VGAPKDGHTRGENTATQPLVAHRVFNNPDVVTEGWYPICPSRELRRGKARSYVVLKHRIVVFRGEDGTVRALDAFCPHMGADLGNGRVLGTEIECYFHRWRMDGTGTVTAVPCSDRIPAGAKVSAWPAEEKYGFIWVYSAAEAPYPVPSPPGLEASEAEAWHIGAPVLFAHHHVMMANGIDLQHFGAVHGLDVDFEFEVDEARPGVFEWDLEGDLPVRRPKDKLFRRIVGPRVGYRARFSGGSVVALTYGPNQRLGGTGRRLPPLHILWGCVPLESGVSKVHVFLITRRRRGLLGKLSSLLLLLLTSTLLVVLKDDDVKAFPHMRFNPRNLVERDRSVARLIQLTEKLAVSRWSRCP